jgi:serine/threonine protein kinase/tetratricopeptide (TPR) repeat protein
MTRCPSPELLGRLGRDSLDDPCLASLAAHVGACPDCQDMLERLAAEVSDSGEHRSPPPGMAEPPTIPGFAIEQELGRGGMGVVYQARQPQFARRVAIKLVRPGAAFQAEERRRWLREARATGRVRNRHIVAVHQAGEHDGWLYLVLDLIPGGSLARRIDGPLPARIAAALAMTVARAVEQVHRAGILHLDIKPSNILLDGPTDAPWDRLTPMITDFGIARASDDAGTNDSGPIGARGTPSYMAPEQIAGDPAAIGPRTDVFALGATLYHLLTGRPPFQAASAIETFDLVRTRDPAAPRSLVPALPRDLETIALTCLQKDPRRRYDSAEALANDLQRWLDGFPIRARPVSMLEQARRWCRRRPAMASLLLLLALTVVSSLGGLLTLWRHSEAQRTRAEHALARAVASERTAAGTVDDLTGLLMTVVDAPQMLAAERLDRSVAVAKELAAKLRRDPGSDRSSLVAVCRLDRQLSEMLRRGNRLTEAAGLLRESIGLIEARRSPPGADPSLELEYGLAWTVLGEVRRNELRDDEALACFRKAEAILEGPAGDPRRLVAIVAIDEARRNTVEQQRRMGRTEAARRLVEQHIGMLERLGHSGDADPAIGLLAALARADLDGHDSAITAIRAAVGNFPPGRTFPEAFADRLAPWLADGITADPPRGGPAGPEDRLDPEARADAIIAALEARCRSVGLHPALFPRAARSAATSIAYAARDQRRAGLIDDARRSAALLNAFGTRLIRTNPDVAEFHLILSEAYMQESKFGWPVDDFDAIEEAIRKALGEAGSALRLDPRNVEARVFVAGIQEKFVRLVAGRMSSR